MKIDPSAEDIRALSTDLSPSYIDLAAKYTQLDSDPLWLNFPPKWSDIRFSPLLTQIVSIVQDYSHASRTFYEDDDPCGQRCRSVSGAHVLNIERD